MNTYGFGNYWLPKVCEALGIEGEATAVELRFETSVFLVVHVTRPGGETEVCGVEHFGVAKVNETLGLPVSAQRVHITIAADEFATVVHQFAPNDEALEKVLLIIGKQQAHLQK